MVVDEEKAREFRLSVLAGIMGGLIVTISTSIRTSTGTWYSQAFWSLAIFIVVYVLSMKWAGWVLFRKKKE